MSEVATEAAATESPAAEAGETPNAELVNDPMFEALAASVGLVADPPKPEEEKPEEPATEAKSDDEADDAEAPEEWDDLGDDKPWTAERHKKVAEQHRSDRRKITGLLSQLNKREGKLKKKLETFRGEKQQMDLLTRRVMADLEIAKTGAPGESLAALSRLTGQDPHHFYEQVSLAQLGKAPKKPEESPVVKALEAKIDQLTAKLEQREQAQSEEQTVATAQHHVRAVLQAADEWPLLAAKAAAAPEQIAGEFWQLYVQESRSAGRWLDVQSVADRIERTLRRKMPSHQATNGATGSGPDRAQETRAQANPETAQSPPRSLSPSLSATSGAARREPTEKELKDELVRNAPQDFWNSLGNFG